MLTPPAPRQLRIDDDAFQAFVFRLIIVGLIAIPFIATLIGD